jgi:histidinol-phosphate aminotransferase
MTLPIRPNVRATVPYSAGSPLSEVARELGLTEIAKLGSNENPLGPSPFAVQAIREAAITAHLYPEGSGVELKAAIAQHYGFPAGQVVLGNGSDELIRMLGWIMLGTPEDEVLCGDPSFVCYDETANFAPCRLVKVPLDRSFSHDLPAMSQRISERTRLIFIANPNNPTGTIVRRRELEAFLRDVPPTALVVLDEAYFEFASAEPEYPDGQEYVSPDGNVAALRTFSKAYGLAGLRCGYGLVPSEIADAVNRVRQPFNVNALAQAAAVAALKDRDHVQRSVENNRRGIAKVSKALREAGAAPAESFGNFVFADFGRPVEGLVQALLEQGVLVRSCAAFHCPTCLRVSVGTEKEVERFVEALRSTAVESAR